MTTSAFLKCSHPVQIQTLKGLRLVRCGKCVQCRDFKRQTLSSALQTECFAHKYHLFITLTYDNDNIPCIDFRDNKIFREDSYNYKMDGGYPIFGVVHNLRLNNDSVSLPINYGDIAHDSVSELSHLRAYLGEYNDRRHKYMARYPQRDFSGFCFQDDVVPFVHYPDLQKFMKRLRKKFYKDYGEKVRFYAVGEYGTNGLRPHWHIILNHDCKAFADYCSKEESWTYVRTRSDGKELYSNNYIHPLWQFGSEITESADCEVHSYLASYVNQSASYPMLLRKWFPQRCSHSSFLGEFRTKENMVSLFRSGNFEELTTIRKVVKQRSQYVEQNFAAPLSSYSRFTPRFSGIGAMSVEEVYKTLASGVKLLRRNRETPISKLVEDIYCTLYDGEYKKEYDDIVRNYGVYLQNAIDNHTPSTILTYLYACRRVQKICDELNITLYDYVHKLYMPFINYLKQKQLCKLYTELEQDNQLAKDYYNSFDSEGNQSYGLYRQSRYYLVGLQRAVTNYDRNIKHLSVAESYKF